MDAFWIGVGVLAIVVALGWWGAYHFSVSRQLERQRARPHAIRKQPGGP